MPVRIAPLALTIIGTLCVAGIIVLTALGQPVPDTLPTLATVALSALAGALIPGPHAGDGRPPEPSSPAASALNLDALAERRAAQHRADTTAAAA